MSSSSHVEPARLPVLGTDKPAARSDAFVANPRLEVLRAPDGPPPTADEAYARGLAEGEQRGRDATRRELAPVVDRLSAIGRSLLAARREVLIQAERDIASVGHGLAREILHSELRIPSDVAVRLAQRCIEAACDEQGALTLHVAPQDLELVRTHIPALELKLQSASLALVADPHLTQGGVVLEAALRCYDGRPDRLLDVATRRIDAAESALDAPAPADGAEPGDAS